MGLVVNDRTFLGRVVGARTLERTAEDFTVSLGGTDPTIPVRITTQAEADAIGAFATVQAILDALPDFILHVVSIELPDGITNVGETLDLSRFVMLDRFLTLEATAGAIRFTSENGRQQVAGTSSYTATSSGTTTTITPDPGFTPDEHRKLYAVVTAGAGAGNFKPIRTHDSDELETVGNLGASASTIEIQEPAATLQFDDNVNFPGIFTNPETIVQFDNIYVGGEFGPGSGLVLYGGGGIVLQNGVITYPGFGIATSGGSGSVFLADFILDGEAGGGAPLILSASFLRTSIGSGAPCYIAAIGESQPCVNVSGSVNDGSRAGGYLFGGSVIEGGTAAFQFDGSNVWVWLDEGGGSLYFGYETPGASGIILRNGAKVQVSDIGTIDGQLNGGTQDLLVDGASIDWATLELDADKAARGPSGSNVWERYS